MKTKILPFLSNRTLIIAISGLTALSAGAYHVTEEPQPVKMLFEECTGILCQSCGWTAPRVKEVESKYSPNMIAIHGKFYSHKIMDLATEEGEEILSYYDVVSFPQAMINRMLFPGMDRHFISEPFWNHFLDDEYVKTAPVNLWMRSWLDEEERLVTIDVEGYCLEDLTDREPVIAIAMTQDGIVGPQSGWSESYYTHNHVLRDYVTPVWGVDITKTKEGDYFKMKFEYELPEYIGVVEVEPDKIKFIAFVSCGRNESLNSVSSLITYGAPEDDEPDIEEPEEDEGTLSVSTLVGDGLEGTTTVYDVNGRVVLSGQSKADTSALAPGIYIVKSPESTSRLMVPRR